MRSSMPNQERNIALARVFKALFWIVLVVVFAMAETPSALKTPELFDWDKLNHGAAFVVLSFLLSYSYPEKTLPFRDFILLMGFGILIEIVQYFVPGRSCSLEDLVADASGLAVFYLLLPPLSRLPILREIKAGAKAPVLPVN